MPSSSSSSSLRTSLLPLLLSLLTPITALPTSPPNANSDAELLSDPSPSSDYTPAPPLRLSTSAIAGIVLSATISLLIFLGAGVWVWRNRRRASLKSSLAGDEKGGEGRRLREREEECRREMEMEKRRLAPGLPTKGIPERKGGKWTLMGMGSGVVKDKRKDGHGDGVGLGITEPPRVAQGAKWKREGGY